MKCVFGFCHRPTRTVIEDFALYSGGLEDCDLVVKDECLYCEVYLKQAQKKAG